MDIWDALKLIARRWYVSIPMIALTLAAVGWTLTTVEPRHTSDGHIMLLPPSTEVNPGDEESYVINPWNTEALTAAVVTRLRNYALFEQLAEEGYRATWEVDTDLQFRSVIVIKTTSDSPGDAQAAVQRLLQVVEQEIDQQQQEYQLPAGAKITSLRLDGGENLEITRGNQARALVVVFGIGGILTLVVTVSTDVLLRARARRRTEADQRSAPPALEGADGAPAAPSAGNGSEPAPARVPAALRAPVPAGAGVQPGITVSYRPPPARSSDSEPAPAAARPEADGDATIILPLAKTGWEPQPRSGDNDGADDAPTQAGRR